MCQTRPGASLQALANGIDNGLKYARPPPGGGEPCVSLSCRWCEEEGKVLTEVWNSFSPPLPDEDLRRAFEWGYRGAAARKSDAEGTGLGLQIARRLVESMGGTLCLHNAPMPGWAAERRAAAESGADAAGVGAPPEGVSAVLMLPRAGDHT